MSKQTKNTHLLILAAGASSRMGRPKLLEEVRGKKLIEHLLHQLKFKEWKSCSVVSGCYSLEFLSSLYPSIQVFHNPEWSIGPSTSLDRGLSEYKEVEKAPLVIVLGDQLYLQWEDLEEMLSIFKKREVSFMACSHASNFSPPLILSPSILPTFHHAVQTVGGKKWIRQTAEARHFYPLEKAFWDIDTPADLKRWKAQF